MIDEVENHIAQAAEVMVKDHAHRISGSVVMGNGTRWAYTIDRIDE